MKEYEISTKEIIEIQVGDWVDVLPNLLPLDKDNGISYEVSSLHESEIGIKVKFVDDFSEVILSPVYVVSNYRKVQK